VSGRGCHQQHREQSSSTCRWLPPGAASCTPAQTLTHSCSRRSATRRARKDDTDHEPTTQAATHPCLLGNKIVTVSSLQAASSDAAWHWPVLTTSLLVRSGAASICKGRHTPVQQHRHEYVSPCVLKLLVTQKWPLLDPRVRMTCSTYSPPAMLHHLPVIPPVRLFVLSCRSSSAAIPDQDPGTGPLRVLLDRYNTFSLVRAPQEGGRGPAGRCMVGEACERAWS
jgi:hypothetical protein